MDPKKSKDLLRKHKKPRPPSSSDSSSSTDSESGSSSESFSSSSSSKKTALKRKTKKIRTNRSRLSTSSDEERARKREKHACHKKLEAKKSHLKRKLKEAKARKRALSPSMRRRSLSPTQKIKKLSMSVAEKKHHVASMKERMREKEREREREREREKDREREKEREKLRLRERIRSRSPKKLKSRSPTKSQRGRDPKRKSPIEKHHMSPREKLICQIRRDRSPTDRKKEMVRRRHDDSRERERRERERAEREAARNKEREEALARCQERQRERERLAREKFRREKEKEYKGDRLLPRPAEREMAIAAARASSRERSVEREPHRSHPHPHGRPSREPVYERVPGGYDREREYLPHEHRLEKDDRREHERSEYVVLRRREVDSPSAAVSHYSERVRGSEREVYPDDQKYEREHTYLPRNYVSPSGEPHHRETHWEREAHHETPREREIDHTKMFPNERPSTSSREWQPSHEENWRVSQKDRQWDEKWPRGGEPPKENWDNEQKFHYRQQRELEDPRLKHDAHREDLPSVQPQHQQHQHPARRWNQEWRGRPNEDRPGNPPGQIQPTFHHNPPTTPHQVEYSHERTEPIPIYRRQHPPKPLIQAHIPHPGGYHIRPHFPPKRQMTYINPNQQTPHALINQNTAVHASKFIATPASQMIGVTSQAQITNQLTSATNQNQISTTIADKLIVGVASEDKMKEKQDQHLTDKELDKTGISKEDKLTGQQTSNEECIRDDLSEISDDADEILNKDEELGKIENEENWDSDSRSDSRWIPEAIDIKKDDEVSNTGDFAPASIISNAGKEDENKLQEISTETSIENNEEVQSSAASVLDESMKSAIATPTTEQEVKDITINDDLLDFEEISDGELEEEATKTKSCLNDALGVDWASLVEESKFKPITNEKLTTAKQKWQPHRVILDIGISLKYAGKEFAKQILNEAKQKLHEEEEQEENKNIETKSDIKIEEDSIIDNDLIMDMKIPLLNEIKKETKDNLDESKSGIESDETQTLDELACIQVDKFKKEQQTKNLVFNACGPNSRALSARRDLKLRRQLCGLPIKEIGFQPPISQHLKNLALKAFQKTLTAEVK